MAGRKNLLPHCGQGESPHPPIVLPPMPTPSGLGAGDAGFDKRLSAYIEAVDVSDIHLTEISGHKNRSTARDRKKKSSHSQNQRDCYFDDSDESPDQRSAIGLSAEQLSGMLKPRHGQHSLQAVETPEGNLKAKGAKSKNYSAMTKMYAPLTAEEKSMKKDKICRADKRDDVKNKAVKQTSKRLPEVPTYLDNFVEEVPEVRPPSTPQMRKKQLITMRFRECDTVDDAEEGTTRKEKFLTYKPEMKGHAKHQTEDAVENATNDAPAKDQSSLEQLQKAQNFSDGTCSGLHKKPDALRKRRRKRNATKVWIYSNDGPDEKQHQEVRNKQTGAHSTKLRKTGCVRRCTFGPAMLIAYWKRKQRAAESGESSTRAKKSGRPDDSMLKLKLHERFQLLQLKRGCY